MYIQKLTLKNYRQFTNETFEFSPNITIISGKNAKGKTTILEALNIITNGKSPWTNENEDIISYKQTSNEPDRYYRIEAEILDSDDNAKQLTIFHSATQTKFEIDKKKVSRRKFYSFTASNLFSPEQIDLLMISPSKRRDFLNNLIGKIDPDYELLLSDFEKIHRQRNAYLKRLAKIFYDTGIIKKDDQQFEYWSSEFAELSSRLMSKRAEIINQLSDEKDKIFIHYKPSLELNLFEDMAETNNIAKIHLEKLLDSAKKDIALGYTCVGAHRDYWRISTDKDIRRFGSRGEKRVALGKLIFRTQELLNRYLGYYPILLLDDISSELDDDNIKRLLTHEAIDKQQVVLTTINQISWLEGLFKHKPKFIAL